MSGELAGDKVVLIGLGACGYDILVEAKRATVDLAQESGYDPGKFAERRLGFLAIGFGRRTDLSAGEHLTLPVIARPPERGREKLDPALLPTDSTLVAGPGSAAFAWLSVLNREAQVLGRLRDLVDDLNFGGSQSWRCYLVCSAADPEGVGLLLPVAGLIRRMFRVGDERRDLLGQGVVLVVPPDLDTHGKAQVAATLREVSLAEARGWPDPMLPDVYCDPAEGERHVFDLGCYLVEAGQEGDGRYATTTLRHQKLVVAEWLAYQCVPEVQASLREDRLGQARRIGGALAEGGGQTPATREDRLTPVFASLGLADYVVPASGVVETCARRLVVSLVKETLLADTEEGKGSETDRMLSGLDASRLQDELAASRIGQSITRSLGEDVAFPWKKPGGVSEAWRRREVMEKDEFPRQILDLSLLAETRAEKSGRDLQVESLSLVAERPAGAFARAAAALRVTGRRLVGFEAATHQDRADEGKKAQGLFARLAAERRRAYFCDAKLPILCRLAKVFAIIGAASLVLSFLLGWLLQRFAPGYAPSGSFVDTIIAGILGRLELGDLYSFVSAVGPAVLGGAGTDGGIALGSLLTAVLGWLVGGLDPVAILRQRGVEGLLAAVGLGLTWLAFRCLVRKHVNAIREYLEAVRKGHLLELVASIQRAAGGKVTEALQRLESLRLDVAGLSARLGRELPLIYGDEVTGDGPKFLDFPGRESLVTEAVVESVYQRGTDKALQGHRPALHALATEMFPPERLGIWLVQPLAERDAALLAFCRGKFVDANLPDAETLLVQRLLGETERPETDLDEVVCGELEYGLLERMRPHSSHVLAEREPSQAIGLADPGRSRLVGGIDALRQDAGRLFRLTTGLRYRIVGFTFRQDLRLADLRAYADWEAAYAEAGDPNLLHTRLAFSGLSAPSPAPPPQVPRSETVAPPLVGVESASDSLSGEDQPGEYDWSEANVPAGESAGVGLGESAGRDAADMTACYRRLGLEPGASLGEIENAYWKLLAAHGLDVVGIERRAEQMATLNLAYDCLRDAGRAAGRTRVGGV